MKNIAVITGASSGMGKEFALTIEDHLKVDEIWLISRNKKELVSVSKLITIPTKVLPLDLTKEEDIQKYKKELNKEINIKILINAAGYGIFDSVENTSYEDCSAMIDLNCTGLTKMTVLSLPYMKEESIIINFSSLAGFMPIPYINIYASTKAYVLSFTRSLRVELRKRKIKVMAVAPYWTNTKFFDRAIHKDNIIVKNYEAMYDPIKVVKKAWKDLEKNKEISSYGYKNKLNRYLSKIVPHKLTMLIWLKQQKIK